MGLCVFPSLFFLVDFPSGCYVRTYNFLCFCRKAIVVIYEHIRVADSICFNLKHYVFKTLEDEDEEEEKKGRILYWVIVTNILIDM